MAQAIRKPGALRRSGLAIAALLTFVAGNAGAVSLQQAYEAALRNDPQYRMNYYENEATKENVNLGRSNLLPRLSASYRANRNIADTDTYSTLAGRNILEYPRYISRSSSINLQQPILNLDSIFRYRQGKVQTAQGAKKFESDTNDVIIRVVGAYADALFAEDQVELSRVQRDMYLEQMKVNDRLFEKGEGTKTDMLETQARLDLAEAQLVEARNNAIAMRNTLAGIIGMDPGTLDKLGAEFRFQDLPLKSFEDWRRTAEERNPLLAAGRLAVENARLEIKRQKAGHFPTVDLVAGYSRDDAASLQNYRQDSINRTVGVQVNIPIYQGGAISATTRQAAANFERSRAELDTQSNRIMVELRRSYDLVENSVAMISALERAVASGKELMVATEKSVAGGVRINLDLLNAQQQLYTSQRDLAQARYSYLLGLLRLRADAGTLNADAVREVAAYFR
ncbi:protease secretion system outer membrane protein [Massilia sp. UYP11]|uniref:TolC family outer membrane protein n=1 Tax=Massilia sp. UYP11 TaxID=1756385 RepID=UPI003D213419